MLTVNGIYTGANEINPSWNNVEFTAGNSINGPGNTILYAWCESGCTNSAAASLVWVNLGSDTMAANGVAGNTITIYMNFVPGNVMSGPTSYTGGPTAFRRELCADKLRPIRQRGERVQQLLELFKARFAWWLVCLQSKLYREQWAFGHGSTKRFCGICRISDNHTDSVH